MPIVIDNLQQLPEEAKRLLTTARDVANAAYNRYSGFLVGGAVRSQDGQVFKGTFLENASLGLTICAEAAALLAANTAGATPIVSVAVVGGGDNDSPDSPVVTPCGRCRQLLHEAAYVRGQDIEIYCSNLALSKLLVTTVDELLPYAFGPNSIRNV